MSRFNLFLGSLPEHETTADAANRDRQGHRLGAATPGRDGSIGGPLDQPVEIRAHQLGQPPLRNIPGERHRLSALIDGKNGPDQLP